jgi:hypothetical protein
MTPVRSRGIPDGADALCLRSAQSFRKIGIDEVVKHTDKPDDVASVDPELRMWDALDAGTHDDTLQDAILEHMQVHAPSLFCAAELPATRASAPAVPASENSSGLPVAGPFCAPSENGVSAPAVPPPGNGTDVALCRALGRINNGAPGVQSVLFKTHATSAALWTTSAKARLRQVEETVGFKEDEEPMLHEEDGGLLSEAEEATGAELPEQKEGTIAYSEVRVVGGENMMEERPVTEGLALFDTGVKVGPFPTRLTLPCPQIYPSMLP